MLLLDFPPLEGSFRRSWLVLLPLLPGHEGCRGCWFGLCEATAIWPQRLPPLPSSHPPSSSSATGARVRVPHKPHTGPRHNPGAASALGLRSSHVMTLYADDKCKDRDSGKYKNRDIDKYKSLQQAMSPPPSPFIRRTFMTTHKVLS